MPPGHHATTAPATQPGMAAAGGELPEPALLEEVRRAARQIAAITLSHRSVVRAEVFRTVGRRAVKVAELKPRRLGPGPARNLWNGRDTRKRVVPRGRYTVKVFASTGGARSDPLYLRFRVR